ncbi:MAG: response regulator [Planctomycetota bacterium]|nr:response regulator [Planctomycetota bacterium]
MMTQRTKSLIEGGQPFDSPGASRDAGLVSEALAHGLCVCEFDGRLVLENAEFRSYSPAVRARVAELCRATAADAISGRKVRRRRTFKGSLVRQDRTFEVVVSMLPGIIAGGGAPGAAGRVAALVRDVTARERFRRKLVALDRAGNELVHLEPETIEKMHVAERLKVLESKVVRFAHDLLHFDHFAVRLLNENSRELELVIATGLSEKACSIKLYARPDHNGISGFVASTGRSYICNDVSKDPLYVYGLDQAGSSLTVPLKLFDRVIGVFNVESASLNAFGPYDRQFAEIFGHYIAMALHILNLLVVERYTTSQNTTGNVQGELTEPLNDLSAEAQALKDTSMDPEVARHVERILRDVEAIRKRMKNIARGPQTLLGADEAVRCTDVDPALESRRVLVVDNEEETASTIREVLTRRGCAVAVCNDGESAKKLLLQWELSQDPDDGFDLVLSDINIGDATGYEIFASAKAARPDIPVILMTGFGYDPHHSIVRASQEGLQCVLFKPFQVEKLVDEVRRALRRDCAGDQVAPPL